jgi:hypothetical protein
MVELGNETLALALSRKANFGLARNTWATYKTSVNHLGRCQNETGMNMNLPFDLKKTLTFVGWMEARGLKASTMSTYLSGLRMYHLATGVEIPCLREPLVQLILKGQDNYDKVRDKVGQMGGRLPVTINIMRLLKRNLVKVAWSMTNKRLFWVVATLAFAGSFRIHELCSRTGLEYCEQTTLLWGDVKLGRMRVSGRELEYLSVHVKSPKVEKIGAGDKIQVFQLDNFMCPIAAFKRYREVSRHQEDQDSPVFRMESGACFFGKTKNENLKTLTSCLRDLGLCGEVKSHSFRSGVSSEMARAGYSEAGVNICKVSE